MLILIVLLILSGCDNATDESEVILEANNDDSVEYEPEYGGELALPVTNVNGLNPLTVTNSSYYYFSKLIFEGLFEFDENFNIVNQLAEDYSFKGNNTISIKLKDNVFWHDGERFTSDDVAFTINTIKYASNETAYKKMWNSFIGNYNYSNINKIINVKVIDELNIDIEFDSDFNNKLEILTFPIVPKHRFVKETENKESYERALAQENYIPIGTGPYEFVDYEKFKTIDLKCYENYREGRPYIDKITGKILDDKELALTSFEAGQVDLALSDESDWEKFDQNNRVRIVEYISQYYEFLGFNFGSDTINKYGNGLRKAIAYGIDRQAIVENVYLGHATQTDLPIHPNSWLISDNSNVYGYSPDKAKGELEKVGLKDLDNDGFYEDEKGNDVTLKLITNSYNLSRLKTADMIVKNLNDIGLKVIKYYPEDVPENLTEDLIEKQWTEVKEKILGNDYDIALLGWSLSPVPELTFAFHSSRINSNTNFIKYSNEVMDNALLEASKASGKQEKLKAYEKLQGIILKELPYVSLFFRNTALVIDSKVKGDIDPTYYDLYRNIESWYIPKDFQ